MPNDEVCAGINEAIGEDALLTHGFQMMFPAPMGRNDDDSGGVRHAQIRYPTDKIVVVVLTHTPAVRQPGIILKGHAQGWYEPYISRTVRKQHGL